MLVQEETPSYYLYQQRMGEHVQTGLVAVAAAEDYLENKIKKHEFTRPDKENDRMTETPLYPTNTKARIPCGNSAQMLQQRVDQLLEITNNMLDTSPFGISRIFL